MRFFLPSSSIAASFDLLTQPADINTASKLVGTVVVASTRSVIVFTVASTYFDVDLAACSIESASTPSSSFSSTSIQMNFGDFFFATDFIISFDMCCHFEISLNADFENYLVMAFENFL